MSEPDIRVYLETRTAHPSGFSPDAATILVGSDEPGTTQLYRLARADVEPDGLPMHRLQQLTATPERISGGYLPTGQRLLLATDSGGNERHQLYTLDDPASGAPPVGSVDELTALVTDPEHIHRTGGVTRDGTLLAYETNRRTGADFDVWTRNLTDGRDELVHAPGGWTWADGFSPDGEILAVGAATERAGDSTMHLLDRRTGALTELAPHDEPAEVGAPNWLPDASAFYFAADVGRDFSGIALGTPDGAWEYVLTPDRDAGCTIDRAGRHLVVTTNVDGWTEAVVHDAATLAPLRKVPLPGRGTAGGFRLSQDGRWLSYSFSSARVPGDGWLLDLDTGESRRLTRSTHRLDEASLVEPDLVRVPAHDGEQIPLFVYRPRHRAPGTRSPVVMVIHGGPESQHRPSFGALTQYLVARGFAVLAPNVRGSTGYGRRYQALDDVGKRFDAITDLASLHAWIAASDDLDPERAALYGGSYGGYMVLAGLAFQPELWAAGVSVVGMSSLVTFLRNTSVWRRSIREREYGSLAHDLDLLEALSPINRLDDMRAPLFLVHGVNDPRVPVGEAEQIHAALTRKGVRTELALYPDEGHGLAKLANRLDAYPRVTDFLVDVLRA